MDELMVAIPDNLETMRLPDPGYVNFWKLYNNRMIYIDTEIDDNALELQKNILCFNLEDKGKPIEERQPIKILINSPGGYLAEVMSLASTFRLSKTPIWTYNIGASYSGACILLVAGHKRFALPYSFALFHSGSGGISGTFEQTQEAQKQYKKQVDDMNNFFLQHTTVEEKVFKRNKSKDWYFSADEQIKFGLVDEIITSIDDIV